MTPEAWVSTPLKALVEDDITYGVVQPGPDAVDGVLFVRSGDVAAGHLRPDSLRTITKAVSQQFQRTVLRGGELLIALVGQPGASVVAPRSLVGANIARQVGLVRLKPGSDVHFVRQFLASPQGRSALLHETLGSVQQVINLRDLEKVPILVPPLAEQKKIASILSSLDEAIDATQAVIDQLQVVKKAMMAELLTRGLPGRHARFKHTEIGEVPEEWKVVPLSEVAFVQTGIAKGKPVENGVELPYLRVANVQDGRVDLSELKTILVEERSVGRYSLRSGDVLFTEGGDADKLGRGCVWRGQIAPCLHQNHVFAVRTVGARLQPEYLAYLAASPGGKAYFLDSAKQTTNLASINSTQLKAFPVPLASLEEQAEIVGVIAGVDSRTACEEGCASQLRALKAALMSVLLTGEIRVKPEEEAA